MATLSRGGSLGTSELKGYLQQLCSLQFDQFDEGLFELPEASDTLNKFLRETSAKVVCVSQTLTGALFQLVVLTLLDSYRLSGHLEYTPQVKSTLVLMKTPHTGTGSVASQFQVLHLRDEGDYPLQSLLEQSLLPFVESKCSTGGK